MVNNSIIEVFRISEIKLNSKTLFNLNISYQKKHKRNYYLIQNLFVSELIINHINPDKLEFFCLF